MSQNNSYPYQQLDDNYPAYEIDEELDEDLQADADEEKLGYMREINEYD